MKWSGLLILAVALTACASVVNGLRQNVALSTQPLSAEVVIFNRAGKEVYRGTTPATVRLARGHSYFKREVYTLAFARPNREPFIVEVRGSLDGWYWGNFAIGGALGMLIVDPLTGGMFELPPKVTADVAEGRIVEPNPAGPRLKILTVSDLPPTMRSQIVPIAPEPGPSGTRATAPSQQ